MWYSSYNLRAKALFKVVAAYVAPWHLESTPTLGTIVRVKVNHRLKLLVKFWELSFFHYHVINWNRKGSPFILKLSETLQILDQKFFFKHLFQKPVHWQLF